MVQRLLWQLKANVEAETEPELKKKKQIVEDALNATKAVVEECIKVGSDIVKRALGYPMKLILKNDGQISLESRHP
nr:RuBisCO large subunit-binding protein subunit beta, chloroplastic [Tanacetum cinerariifolium]